MAKAKKSKLKRWRVPLEWTLSGYCVIEAATLDDAAELAEHNYGQLDSSGAEVVNWEVVGTPELEDE